MYKALFIQWTGSEYMYVFYKLCHKSFIHQNIPPYTEYGVSVCMYSKLKWLLDHIGHQANLHLVYM